MININTGQNPVDTAMQIIGNKLQQQRRGIVVRENGNPPTPPAYVKVKRAQSKCKPKQLRLGI